FWAGTPEYAVLYGKLSVEDAAQVAERLKSEAVPYRLQDGGRTVLVPSDQVYDLRLLLAGEGVPQGGVVGFEIFDQSGFGMTDFAQKVNYTRALEGELTRTIRRLEGVEGARVHLVLPERRLFEAEQQPASASVVLQLAPGRRLGAKQIQGVVYLVSSSVQGLAPDGVTVVDTQGNVLYQSSGDEPGLLAASQLEFKRAYEKEVERRVREMLERVLGSGAAVVQVSARFDFDRVEETSETFDPEAVAVRSEERQSESSSGPGGPAGVPGVASNVTGAPAAGGSAGGASSRETETVNYEVSKKVTRVQKTPGALTRLTVAVAVDGTYREGEGGAKEFVPRTAEELAQMRSLVEKAVGHDSTRGDEVEVTSIPFRPAETLETPRGFWGPDLISTLAKYGAFALVALLLVVGVARPLLRWLGSATPAPQVIGPVTVAEMERKLAAEAAAEPFKLDETTPTDTVKRETLKKRLGEMVQTEPDIAAQLIRSWMTEE
ncbi:MAG: flagellar M-ring protein FliF, partial [Proteobacteria bacterium]|nr:flagellar M-ring protein FliF [Pseudomonadota bacterium]